MRRLALLSALIACRPADIEVVSVEELGPMEPPASIVGRDGGVSGLFQGRSVWVYGDSVATEAGTFPNSWRNNTMSWTEDLDASDGITGFVQPVDALGAPDEFFPRSAREQAFNEAHTDHGDGRCKDPCGARYAIWGGAPVVDEARNRALLPYAQVYGEPGEWNFWLTGTSLAVWEDFVEGPWRPDMRSPMDDPTLLFDAETEGEFGPGANIVGEHLYLFSCSGAGAGRWNRCRLARAPLDEIFSRSAWRFKTKKGWSADIDDAVPLFEGSPNMTVHWSEHLGRWLAFYMDWGEISVRTAEAIDGPWSDAETVYKPEQPDPIHAGAHPEYQERGGEVEYLTYLAEDFHLLRVHLQQRGHR